MNSDYYVYVIYRNDGVPCYVGKGRKGRWLVHARKTHNEWLGRIYKRSGGRLPIAKIAEGLSDAEAIELEVLLISEIGRANLGRGPLVNFTDGGEGTSGRVVSPEESAKHGARIAALNRSRRGQKLSPAHVQKLIAFHTGKKRPPGTGEKIAASLRGRKRPPHVVDAMHRHNGRPWRQESRDKLSASLRGRKLSAEHIVKTAAGLRGRRRSLEERQKISEGMTAEGRERLSVQKRAYWERWRAAKASAG